MIWFSRIEENQWSINQKLNVNKKTDNIKKKYLIYLFLKNGQQTC